MPRARRATSRPPGSLPSADSPRSMQLSITDHTWESPSFSSAPVMTVSSLARFMPAMESPEADDISSISAALPKG